jgi:hypothetical protein
VWLIGEQALAAEKGRLKNLKTTATTLLQVDMKILKKEKTVTDKELLLQCYLFC